MPITLFYFIASLGLSYFVQAAIRLTDERDGEYFLRQILWRQITSGDARAFETVKYLGRRLSRTEILTLHTAAVSRGAYSVAYTTAKLLRRELLMAEVVQITSKLIEGGKYELAAKVCTSHGGDYEKIRANAKQTRLRCILPDNRQHQVLEALHAELKHVQAILKVSSNISKDRIKLDHFERLLKKFTCAGKLCIAREIAQEIFKIVAVREPWARAFFLCK